VRRRLVPGLVPHGRAVQADSIKTRVESAYGVCNQHLKLQYGEPVSSFGFNFNLRRYVTVVPREWMWRHFTASPGGLWRRPYTAFTAVVSHASVPALASHLMMVAAVAPDAQQMLGGAGSTAPATSSNIHHMSYPRFLNSMTPYSI